MNRQNSSPIRPDECGDYDSPTLRTLRESWNLFLESQAAEEDVLAAIAEARTIVDRHIDQLQAQIDANISDPHSPLFRTVAQAFMEHLEALSLMEREFELEPDDPDYDDFFERGYQLAQEATNRMMKAHEEAMSTIDQSRWTDCSWCESRNLVTNRECHSCRRPLHKSVEMVSLRGRQSFVAEEITVSPTTGSGVTQNYTRVKQAVDQWLQGEVGVHQVMSAIKEVEIRLTTHLEENDRELETIRRRSSRERAVRAALEATRQGLESSLASLGRLTRVLSEPQPKTPVVRVRMVELESLSRQLIESYFQLKQAHEAAEV